MNREELFLAIGKADGRQLLKSEQSRTPEEQPRKRSHRPAFPKWTGIALAALVLASALGTAAFFLLGGSPNDLPSLSGAGGNPGQSDSALLSQDSASADNLPVYLRMEQPDVAEWVTNPTRSIQWKGYTLTAEKQLHDSATGSGVLIYSLENPDGIPKFETNDTGEVWFPDGDLVDISHFHKNYIVKEQTTKTKLTVACFYRQVEMNEPLEELYDPNLELTLSEYAACSLKEMEKMAQKLTTDAEFEQWAQTLICPETNSIPLDKLGNLGTVKAENGAIVLSPISLFIDAANMEFLTTSTGINVQSLALRFQDGTQYVIKNGDSVNCAYEALEPRLDPQNPYRVIPPDKDPEGLGYKEYNWMPQNAVTYLLDRMVDITKAEAIIINGTEITLT